MPCQDPLGEYAGDEAVRGVGHPDAVQGGGGEVAAEQVSGCDTALAVMVVRVILSRRTPLGPRGFSARSTAPREAPTSPDRRISTVILSRSSSQSCRTGEMLAQGGSTTSCSVCPSPRAIARYQRSKCMQSLAQWLQNGSGLDSKRQGYRCLTRAQQRVERDSRERG